MLKALLALARLFVTVPFFELVGSVAIVAGVWVITGNVGWALVTLGGLALLKAFDRALEGKK
jgi:hypothetical protein